MDDAEFDWTHKTITTSYSESRHSASAPIPPTLRPPTHDHKREQHGSMDLRKSVELDRNVKPIAAPSDDDVVSAKFCCCFKRKKKKKINAR